MKLTFCGAAGTVTGSSHWLTTDDGYQVLMDCGLYQGHDDDFESFNKEWIYKPEQIDVLVVSHAHIDHSGRIPKLVKDGFNGRIYCTHATRDLMALMLMDSAYIQVKDAEYFNRKIRKKDEPKRIPLYTPEDVKDTLDLIISIGYEQWTSIHQDIDLIFKDAGHILGSASVTLRIHRPGLKDTWLGFTGDIGRPDRPILKDPKPILPCDYLICESTYGNKIHESNPDQKQKLLKIIENTCIRKNGRLIIPAFSVGRTQEIVYMIDQLENEGKLKHIPVYVDSPLATNATEVYRMHPECFDAKLTEYMNNDPNPFGFNRLTYVKSVEESKSLNNKKGCIIISASGMITAGRILHHVFNSISKPENTILIVGYCARHTIGARLAQGKEHIRIFGQHLPVLAEVAKMNSFSAHGDQKEMIDFLHLQDKKRMRKLFLVHGDPKRQEAFAEKLNEVGFDNVVIPHLRESFQL